jgi:hypothetical protein
MQLDTATEILDGFRPRSVSEYRMAFINHLARHGRREQPQPESLKAGIDCGRWVVNCECGSGIALHPDWQFAACLLCGRSWAAVEFPSPVFLIQLEKLFRQRPPGTLSKNVRRFWSWWPTESLEDIVAENTENGWVIPEGLR